MDRNRLFVRLLSGAMVDDETHAKRLGFWLRMARERAGKSQEGAARELGLSAASKSTVSDWENGVREPALRQLRRLARYYDVPISLFVDPPATAFEDLDRFRELASAAVELEQEDWESAQGQGPTAGGGPDDAPATRSA